MIGAGSRGNSLTTFGIARLTFAASLSLALASCTTSTTEMAQNPRQVPKVNLCRTLLETQDPILAQTVITELNRRDVNMADCPTMVQQQIQAAAAVAAVALVGAAVAVCANGCASSNSYYRPLSTYHGNCQHSWQLDAAGNRCGARAADVRPGGYGGYSGGYHRVAPAVSAAPVSAGMYPAAPSTIAPAPPLGRAGFYSPAATPAFIPRAAPPSTYRQYITGPRGGCYYINGNGNKSYVDRSMC